MVEPRATDVLGTPADGLGRRKRGRPSAVQHAWLQRGLGDPGGKLPLFDEHGRSYSARTIRSCIEQGWAEPWIHNAIKPEWLVCRLTDAGRAAARMRARARSGAVRDDSVRQSDQG
ncbi:MAG: hypothetical protein ACE5GS_07635 [Kiloniellaceae bacterium]